jgi:hypothetical protein
VGRGAARGRTTRGSTPELLAHGDRRNVADHYRYWRHEAIVADLDTRRHAFHVAVENWQHDANIGSVVRSANAFLAAEVHIVGRRRWNRRGAMVTDRYQHVRHHDGIREFADWSSREALPIVGLDNVAGSGAVGVVRVPGALISACIRTGGPRLSSRHWPPCSDRRRPSPSTARLGRSTSVPQSPSRCTPGPAARTT